MAEALPTSYCVIEKEPRSKTSQLLGSAKKAEASVRKSIKNYYTASQYKVRDGADSLRGFASQENCLGCLFNWRKNSYAAEDEEGPQETSKLLGGSAGGGSYSACQKSEEFDKEPERKTIKRVAKEMTEKVTDVLRTAGGWLVKGLQGYAEAVHPTGFPYSHDTVTTFLPPFRRHTAHETSALAQSQHP
ncbi:uncharacterized protein [Palaemon carinicauda]|uniref:uncharacterized protein n=1 Tax=Palaemon carinicauda TaxID=392227 RepID=UPI0035B67C0B